MPDAIQSLDPKASFYTRRTINIGGNAELGLGVGRSDAEGYEEAPSMVMRFPAKFRFRLSVEPGNVGVTIRVKQASNVTPRPTLTLLANSAVGLTGDLSGSAAAGEDWTLIGPLEFTATAKGVVVAEFACHNVAENDAGCFWDRLTS